SDWIRQRPRPVVEPRSTKPVLSDREKSPARLSYKQQRELASIPNDIESLEREQAELTARMSSADYHRQAPQQIRNDRKRAEDIEALLLEKFRRWEELEETRNRYG